MLEFLFLRLALGKFLLAPVQDDYNIHPSDSDSAHGYLRSAWGRVDQDDVRYGVSEEVWERSRGVRQGALERGVPASGAERTESGVAVLPKRRSHLRTVLREQSNRRAAASCGVSFTSATFRLQKHRLPRASVFS